MKTVTCSQCKQEFPLNETVAISQQTMCHPCGDTYLKANSTDPKEIEANTDMTVCASCGKDNGVEELGTLCLAPVCAKCEAFFRNRPYPAWVKLAMATVVILVIFSMAWNWRFVQAMFDLQQCKKFMVSGDIAQAGLYYDSAAAHVPESKDLGAMASLCRGWVYLGEYKSAEALEEFTACRSLLPEEFGIESLIMRAKAGIAFKEKDYDKLLELSLKMSRDNNKDQVYAGGIASAYACKYAETGDEQFKKLCLEALEQYKQAPGENPYLKESINRMEHRLYTREIISPEKFLELYPDGWVKPDDAESYFQQETESIEGEE